MRRRFFQSFLVLFLCFSLSENAHARPRKKYRARRRPASESSTKFVSSDTSYLQRILYLENQRIAKDKFLIACLSHSSRRVVNAALLALGRIGDTSGLDEMARLLSGRDMEFA